MLLSAIALSLLWLILSPYDQLVNAIVVLAILVFGFRLGFGLLPPWARDLVGGIATFFLGVLASLFRFAFGIGIKGGRKK
jgi:hypothetical protein